MSHQRIYPSIGAMVHRDDEGHPRRVLRPGYLPLGRTTASKSQSFLQGAAPELPAYRPCDLRATSHGQLRTQTGHSDHSMISVTLLAVTWSGGQGRGRTADLPLFSQAANHPNPLQRIIVAYGETLPTEASSNASSNVTAPPRTALHRSPS